LLERFDIENVEPLCKGLPCKSLPRNYRKANLLRRQDEGMNALIEKLGLVEAKKFIALIQRNPFDYTKWSEKLFEGMTLGELSQKAKAYRESRG
jgi:hypothetical protein